MALTKTAQTLAKGDVIVPDDDMPMQVDHVQVIGQSVGIFYFTGREDTSLNVSLGHTFTVLGPGETWCDGMDGERHPAQIVRYGDMGEGWCTMSCGCLFEDETDDWED